MTTAILRSFRSLARTPGFAFVAIVTLALALGAIGTVFSVVNAVLLKPLPYPESERILRIVRVQGSCTDCPIARPALFDWQEQTGEVFEAVGAFTGAAATLTGPEGAEKLTANAVTPEFWQVMAVPAMLGRTFTAEEDRTARDVVVISNELWQRRFGGDRGVLGRSIVINGEPHEVVGVMPDHFRYPGSDVLLPAQLASATIGRDTNYLNVVARLRPGVPIERAEQVLAAVTARQASAHPDEHEGLGARMMPLKTRVTSTVKPALNVLFAAAAIVVLIACANLANLMLARAQSRRRELAVRGALGASRGRLVRHLLGESFVIAVAGSFAGAGIAIAAVAALPKLAPNLLPDYNPLVVDATAFGFVAFVAVLALFGFGLVPAWRNSAGDPGVALQDEARGGTAGRARSRARGALVVTEVALSLVLLTSAALLLESLRRIGNVDPTIEVDRVLTARVALPPTPKVPGESDDAWWARHSAASSPRVEALLARVAAIPGVERVALTDAIPLSGRSNTNSTVRVVGREFPGGELKMPSTEWRFVSEDYFRAVGLDVQRGRGFTAGESREPSPPTAVLVNDVFVRTFLEGVDPLGQQVSFMDDVPKTIVGVVESARQWGLASEPSPEVYLPVHDAFAIVNDLDLVVAARVPPAQLAEPLRVALREALPEIPVTDIRTLADVAEEVDVMRRFFATIMIAFSAVALVLAMVGLYGVIAYSVVQRRAEIGVRMSLGADTANVLRMVLRQGLGLVGLGLAFGVAGALALARAISSQLYGVAPWDPIVLGGAALALLLTGAAACGLPAWRAARIAPTEALRHA